VISFPFTAADWWALAPVGAVGVAGLLVLLADLFARKHAPRYLSIAIGLAGAVVAAVLAAQQYGHDRGTFFGGFMTGGFTTVFEFVVLIALAGSLVLYGTMGDEDVLSGTVALLLWSSCGAMLMAGSANLMTVFLGLELLSLALYCLCGLADRKTAREAALKYLILSSTASGFLLYGMALLFGATGSVQFADFVNPALASNAVFWLGAGLFLVGLAFKMSLVPFHTWAPDVYEGAPLPVTAFMSVATKAAVLAVFARFAYAALPSAAGSALLLPIWIVAGISMIVGNVGMLAQHDLKRLLGYSGIAQVGYILTAFAGTTALGLRYALYYLVAYAFMNLGAFAVAAAMSRDGEQGSSLRNYAGLAHRRPWLAAAMTFFLIAMAGLPPTAGFLGKILILSSSVGAGYVWMAALLIAGTAISLYAYAKIVFAMYSRGTHRVDDVRPFAPLAWLSAGLCTVVVIAMAFYPLTPSDILPLVR
jgi:NADH-quinone oxidoreductase subunit N